ncbi:uncharacterized protein LOC121641664 [Melanotaenia boesemani]|uniref:uncharacterized protein LOC121641663 n=1 Tax=Melanotaenia boesemani TaxID=1250792 RepID=UPI001C046C40|nr:uncharacterized protein LOC121641663 [Melanotaenia boesemani]XP_041843876.1 uncharacterized protein LOC121641664 [Melanotaenia boesemani]
MIEEVRLCPQQGQLDHYGYQAPVVRSGGRGRPQYRITGQQLSFLASCGFTAPQIAGILNVSSSTVRRRLRRFQRNRASRYAELTDSALDDVVLEVVAGNEQLGPEAVRASLRVHGLLVQRSRVRASMLRTNPGAAALRAVLRRPERRAYQVAGPNSLWHIDGNHKLIRWRIVIHGGVDGYSRLVVFLHASNNNRSSTVLTSFINAVANYGVPSRVRTDRGGENNDVWLMMNIFRGFDRGSALRGRSTHNQRIERLWGDLWRGVTNVYYDLFRHLEEEDIIDIDNEMHLWALHYVFLPRINRDLTEFAQQWNNHGLRTERHQSPLQVFVRGCLEQQDRHSTAMLDIFGPVNVATHGDNGTPAVAGVTVGGMGTADDDAGGDGADELGALLQWPETISVPDINFTIAGPVVEQIQAQFDSLSGPRTSLGLEIITGLISFMNNLHRN